MSMSLSIYIYMYIHIILYLYCIILCYVMLWYVMSYLVISSFILLYKTLLCSADTGSSLRSGRNWHVFIDTGASHGLGAVGPFIIQPFGLRPPWWINNNNNDNAEINNCNNNSNYDNMYMYIYIYIIHIWYIYNNTIIDNDNHDDTSSEW